MEKNAREIPMCFPLCEAKVIDCKDCTWAGAVLVRVHRWVCVGLWVLACPYAMFAGHELSGVAACI